MRELSVLSVRFIGRTTLGWFCCFFSYYIDQTQKKTIKYIHNVEQSSVVLIRTFKWKEMTNGFKTKTWPTGFELGTSLTLVHRSNLEAIEAIVTETKTAFWKKMLKHSHNILYKFRSIFCYFPTLHNNCNIIGIFLRVFSWDLIG